MRKPRRWLQVILPFLCGPGLRSFRVASATKAQACNGSPHLCDLRMDEQTFVGLWGVGAPEPPDAGRHCPSTATLNIQDALSYGLRYFAMGVCEIDSQLFACHSNKPGETMEAIFETVSSWLSDDRNKAEVVIISLDSPAIQEGQAVDADLLAHVVDTAFGDHILSEAELSKAPTLAELIAMDKRVVLLWSSTLFQALEEAETSASKEDFSQRFIKEETFFTAVASTTPDASSVERLQDQIRGLCEQQVTWSGPMLRVDVPMHHQGFTPNGPCEADVNAQAMLAVLARGQLEASPLSRLQASCWTRERTLTLVALPAMGMTTRDALTSAGLARSLNERGIAHFAYVAGLLQVLPQTFAQAVRTHKALLNASGTARLLLSTEHASKAPKWRLGANHTTSNRSVTVATTTPEAPVPIDNADVAAFIATLGGLEASSDRIQVQDVSLPDSDDQPVDIAFKIRASSHKGMVLSNQGILMTLRSVAAEDENGIVTVIADCGDPGGPVGGGKSSLVSEGGYTEGAVVEFSCDLGLEVNGSSYRVCDKDALFTGVQPACVPAQSGNLTQGEVEFWKKVLLGLVLFAECLCCSWCCWNCLLWHRLWTIRSAAKAIFESFPQPERGLVSKQDVAAAVESMDADSQGLVDLESFRRAFEIAGGAHMHSYDAISPNGKNSRRTGQRHAEYSWSVGSS
mmetsp:Transcript_58151/g.138401  ORF Transcript_58151/g.138401 Transcript_58151/m.138401 type:complete len:686 (+) Transcript_58151:119-2176(+)